MRDRLEELEDINESSSCDIMGSSLEMILDYWDILVVKLVKLVDLWSWVHRVGH